MNAIKYVPRLTLIAALALTGCTPAADPNQSAVPRQEARAQASLPDGSYDVQSVNYEDAEGAYRIFLLNAPAGSRPVFESNQVQLARLTDEAIKEGKKSYLEVKGGMPALYLSPDFQIAYTHHVTEERVNPETGQPQTVIVRQESSFWSPFLGSLAGAAVGNVLFAPRYYVPPVYSSGGLLGYGGYGSTPASANRSYQQRYGTLPQPSRLSSSGSIFSRRSTPSDSLRSTGSGAGSSRLGSSSQGSSRFGSGRSLFGGGSRSFGTFRRRR
ncbi:hypothetical protein [Anthocerotibacter panamensis]|uniref:hypothetical protein n=1 Tax=Anthocerotibacter panamensis TaxID=2857077 RepID=UPI001C4061B3|nr:hypothetical protein [Anthocerotibacter panamensis]